MSTLAQFDALKANLTLKVAPSLAIKVSCKETQQNALAAGREIKDFAKRIEDTRKSLVKPLNDQVKVINDYAKTLAGPIDQVESHLKRELLAYERILEKERQEQARAAEAARKEKEAEAARLAEERKEELEMQSMFSDPEEAQRNEVIATVEADRKMAEIANEHKAQAKEIASNKVAGARKVWTFEITDESLVPREFLAIDEKKIRAAIKEEVREIPGVRIFQETSIALGR